MNHFGECFGDGILNLICDLQAFRIELEFKIEFSKCRESHNKLFFTGIRLHWSAQVHARHEDQSRVLQLIFTYNRLAQENSTMRSQMHQFRHLLVFYDVCCRLPTDSGTFLEPNRYFNRTGQIDIIIGGWGYLYTITFLQDRLICILIITIQS